MNDEIAIKYYNDNFINKKTLNWNSFKGTHKEYGDYIKSRFDDDISPLESIYRIINNIMLYYYAFSFCFKSIPSSKPSYI